MPRQWMTPTAAHEAAWREWLASRPGRVRAIAERFDPWTMYRLTTTGQRCQFLGCDVGAQNCLEIEPDPERITVRIYAENPTLGAITGTEVFGISADDLQPWTDDIPIPWTDYIPIEPPGGDVEERRLAYIDAIQGPPSGNLTDEQQRAIVAEVRQFLIDMLDVCEQTDVAEKKIGAALDALEGRAPRAVER